MILIEFSGGVQADKTRVAQLQNCVPGSSTDQRQRCDDAVSQQLRSATRTTQLLQGWHLVVTTEPGGRGEGVSIMHTVDSAKSDPGLAGLSLRCGRSGVIEVMLILLEPMAHSDHPKVSLSSGTSRKEFETTVAANGEALLLPTAASALPESDWQTVAELSVEIATSSNPIRGVVPISGIQGALRALSARCAMR
ncbi:hypothetical protein [Bradyrhizobium sp. USDA 4449]